MATFTKILLNKDGISAGTGRGILVAAIATPGTEIHNTGTSSTVIDEVWLWAVNSDVADRKLTIEFGDVTAPNDLVEVTIPAEGGLVGIIPGFPLVGTGGAARKVRAFASVANVVVINGFVNRIS